MKTILLILLLIAIGAACATAPRRNKGPKYFITEHELEVFPAKFDIQRDEIELETERTIRLWLTAYPDRESDIREAVRGIRMTFVPKLVFEAREIYGLAVWPQKFTWVVYQNGWDLSRTSLGHELGHIILWHLTGDGKEDKLREVARQYGIPY